MKLRSGRRTRPYARYVPYARAAYGIGKAVYNKFRGKSYTTTRKRASSGIGVTHNYDKKVIYRYKRMPYRKRKQWRAFSNRTKAVLLSNLGTTSIVRNSTINNTISGTGQNFSVVHLYGKQGATIPNVEVGVNDLVDMAITDSRIGFALGTYTPARKIHYESACLDITYKNLDTVDDIELDVYEIGYTGQHLVDFPNFNEILIAGQSMTPTIGSALSIGTRGCTPFQLTDVLRQGKIKIYKKTKYFLGPQKTMTYQTRDPRNHRISTDQLGESTSPNDSNFQYYGMTRTLLFVQKTVAATAETSTAFYIGATRTYSYKLLEDKGDFDGTF